jgi:hypothetical protein
LISWPRLSNGGVFYTDLGEKRLNQKFVLWPWLLVSLGFGVAMPFALHLYMFMPGLGTVVVLMAALFPLVMEGLFIFAAVRSRTGGTTSPSILIMAIMVVVMWALMMGVGYAVKTGFALQIPPPH